LLFDLPCKYSFYFETTVVESVNIDKDFFCTDEPDKKRGASNAPLL